MKVFRRHKENKMGNERFFYKGSEVSKSQAEAIKSVGGKVVTDRNDEWFWRNW